MTFFAPFFISTLQCFVTARPYLHKVHLSTFSTSFYVREKTFQHCFYIFTSLFAPPRKAPRLTCTSLCRFKKPQVDGLFTNLQVSEEPPSKPTGKRLFCHLDAPDACIFFSRQQKLVEKVFYSLSASVPSFSTS